MTEIGPAYRRLLAHFILFALAWYILTILILPLTSTLVARSDEISDLRFQLSKLQSATSQAETTLPDRERRVREAASKGIFLNYDDMDLANANLQARLKALVNSNQGQLVAARSVRSKPLPNEHMQPITVSLSVIANTENAQAILHQIEAVVPYLFIDELRIQAPTRQASPSEDLRLSISVTGYVLKEDED